MRVCPLRNDSTSVTVPHRGAGARDSLALWLVLLAGVALHLSACGGDKTTQPPAGGRIWRATANGTGSDCGDLQGCLDTAANGDTIELGAGLYDTVGDTLVAGTCTALPQVTNGICRKNVVVRAARGANVVIDGRGEPGRVGLTVPDNLTDVTIENLTFTNCWAGIGTAGGKVIIRNCVFTVGDHGLEAHETLLDVRDCTFENHTQESINLRNCSGTLQRLSVVGSGAGLASRGGRNLSVTHAQFGPFCAGGVSVLESGSLALTNCTVVGAGLLPQMADSTGVTVTGIASATLERCIVSGNSGYGLSCWESGAATVSCSDFFGNTEGNYRGCADATGQRGNISADPRFCGALDYFLKADSPARLAACGVMGAYAEACGAGAPGLASVPRARE